MFMRSSKSKVTFLNAFALPDYPDELPSGAYEVIVEEELLQGVSFEAYRRTATYLTVKGRGNQASQTEMFLTTQKDLESALDRDLINSDT